jgi:hypothetical protein
MKDYSQNRKLECALYFPKKWYSSFCRIVDTGSRLHRLLLLLILLLLLLLLLLLVGWDWVHLALLPLLPYCSSADDRWWWLWSIWWNAYWQGKLKCTETTCPSATLSTTNPTWLDLGLNYGRRGGKPTTNRLSYGTAFPPQVTACSSL